MRLPHGLTVTVLRPGVEDGFGDRAPDVTHVVTSCGVAPRSSSEDYERGDQVTIGLTLLAPAFADIVATDRVQISAGPFAGVYQVQGRPVPLVSPFSGWAAGMAVALEDVEG